MYNERINYLWGGRGLNTILNTVEEGQAYANYLSLTLLQILEKNPSKDNPDLKDLSQRIGVKEQTISRRVSLLVLPEYPYNIY